MGLYEEPLTWNALSIETIILSTISNFSLIFTLYCYWKFEKLQTDSFKLVSNIMVFDLLYTTTIFIVAFSYQFVKDTDEYLSQTHPILCQLEAFLSLIGIIGSCFWTSIICHSLYIGVMGQKSDHLRLVYSFVGYVLPTAISIIPFFLQAYGTFFPMPQTNCFIQSYGESNLNSSLFFYIPVEVSFLYNITIIIIVIVKIKSQYGSNWQYSSQLFILFIYPSILLICWVLPAILAQAGVQGPNILFYISYATGALIGFFDALCYSYVSIRNTLSIRWCEIKYIQQEDLEESKGIETQNLLI